METSPLKKSKTDTPSLLSLFLDTPIGNHTPRATTGDVQCRKVGPVLVVQRDESLPRVFRKLAVEGFLSAPVLDGNTYVGFIDMMDLVKKTTSLFWGDTVEAWTTFWDKEEKFQNTTVDEIMKVPNEWRRDPYPPLASDYSSFYALEMMVRHRLHRVALLDPTREFAKRVVGIVTESMFISWLRQNKASLGAVGQKPVSEMMDESKAPCKMIHENQKAINAFNIMADAKVSGLAVVDDAGILVNAISITDLRAVGESGEYFHRLFRPINKFKELAREEFPRLAPRTHFSRKQVPRRGLFVTPDQTFEDVLEQMNDGNIHRVFVCDNATTPRPICTIEQHDILKIVLDQIIQEARTA
jgi:CBS domain-containing protein